MNDHTAEVPPIEGIVLGRTTSVVIISLAIYGGMSLTRDTVRFAKKIRKNKETEVEVETDSEK